MSPSARNSTRSAIAAACASWVTITVVWPRESTESRSSARISPLVVEMHRPTAESVLDRMKHLDGANAPMPTYYTQPAGA